MFFILSAFFVSRILLSKEWLFDRQGWTVLEPSIQIDADYKFYYLLYVARFVSDLVSIFFEERKKVCYMKTVRTTTRASDVIHILVSGWLLSTIFVFAPPPHPTPL
jgi:hypothetical protein